MANQQLVMMCAMAVVCSGQSQEATTECQPNEPVLKIEISNDQNATGRHLQINFDEGARKSTDGSWKIAIDHNPSCSGQETTSKISDIPRPFYELFPGQGFYKLNMDAKTWHQAKEVCEREGAHLAVINSREEVEVLRDLRRRVPRNQSEPNYNDDLIHLGISDEAKEGDWRTIFNESLGETGFADWDAGQPGSGEKENCGCFYLKTEKLHDCGCADVYSFFCERAL